MRVIEQVEGSGELFVQFGRDNIHPLKLEVDEDAPLWVREKAKNLLVRALLVRFEAELSGDGQ